MKIYNLNKEIGVVEVPPNCTKVRHLETINELEIVYGDVVFGKEYEYIKLVGNWQFLSLSKDMTEEGAKIIMPTLTIDGSVTYLDFMKSDYFPSYPFKSALESLRSWERANGYIQDVDCSNQWCDNGKIDVGYGEHTFCEICGGSGSQQQVVNIAYLIKG